MNIKGVHTVKARGGVYVYAWRGGPRVKAAPGTDAFLIELAAARAARQAGEKTLARLCQLYRASPLFAGMARKTQTEWARWLDKIQKEFGAAPTAAFNSPKAVLHISKWREQWGKTPRTADVALEVFSRLLSYGRSQGMLSGDPCKEIPRLYKANRAALIWTEEDLTAFEKTANPALFRTAKLAALTGLRQGDLLRLRWDHVKANSVEITTGKSGHAKTTLIPIYAELRKALDACPRTAVTVLTSTQGKPWGSGFGASWQRAKPEGPLHFHDLRGTAATRFFLAGLTIREIAEIMTWSEARVDELINRYVKRDELLLDRIRRLDRNVE